jgi:hypothetical protein
MLPIVYTPKWPKINNKKLTTTKKEGEFEISGIMNV